MGQIKNIKLHIVTDIKIPKRKVATTTTITTTTTTMVLYYTSTAVDPPVRLYVGRDKHENEELIRWGWDEDVWFHASKLSSAHIYLRLPEGMTIDTIPEALLI